MANPTPATAEPTSGAPVDDKRWLGLAVIAIAQLMVVLDASIVNAAAVARALKVSWIDKGVVFRMDDHCRLGDVRQVRQRARALVVVVAIAKATERCGERIVKLLQRHPQMDRIATLGNQSVCLTLAHITHTAAQKVQVEDPVMRRADQIGTARQVNRRIDGNGRVGLVMWTPVTVTEAEQQRIGT